MLFCFNSSAPCQPTAPVHLAAGPGSGCALGTMGAQHPLLKSSGRGGMLPWPARHCCRISQSSWPDLHIFQCHPRQDCCSCCMQSVELPDIKTLGSYDASVKLHPEVWLWRRHITSRSGPYPCHTTIHVPYVTADVRATGHAQLHPAPDVPLFAASAGGGQLQGGCPEAQGAGRQVGNKSQVQLDTAEIQLQDA